MNTEYAKIEDLLYDLEEIIANSKSGGLFGGKSFDKDAALDLIEDIRTNLPMEIKQAQKICDNSDRIIEDANNKAKNIIRDAEAEAERLVSNNEITKLAKEKAEKNMEELDIYMRKMQSGSLNYLEKAMTNARASIQQSMDLLENQMKRIYDTLGDEIKAVDNDIRELRENYDSDMRDLKENYKYYQES